MLSSGLAKLQGYLSFCSLQHEREEMVLCLRVVLVRLPRAKAEEPSARHQVFGNAQEYRPWHLGRS